MNNEERKGMPNWIVYLLTFLGVVYLLNPTAGIIEIIPDIAPWVGNLDEGAAALLVWQGLSRMMDNRKTRK